MGFVGLGSDAAVKLSMQHILVRQLLKKVWCAPRKPIFEESRTVVSGPAIEKHCCGIYSTRTTVMRLFFHYLGPQGNSYGMQMGYSSMTPQMRPNMPMGNPQYPMTQMNMAPQQNQSNFGFM